MNNDLTFDGWRYKRNLYIIFLDTWLDLFYRSRNIWKKINSFIMMKQTFNEMCSGGVLSVVILRDWVLFSFQCFEIWVRTLLDITSLHWFSLDDPKEDARIFLSLLHILGGGSNITSLKSSIFFKYIQQNFSDSLSESNGEWEYWKDSAFKNMFLKL